MNGWNTPSYKLSVEEKYTVDRFNKTKNDVVYMSEASVGELIYGIDRSQKKEYNQRKFDALLIAVPSLSITMNVWKIYGKTKAELYNIGKIIPDIDLIIASTAKCYKMTLVANDKHMKSLPDSFICENWATI
jgi:tRNA(fMet)-specific endonuclease VapC